MNVFLDAGRRILGLCLVVLVAFPVFLILDPDGSTTPLDVPMRRAGWEYWSHTWGASTAVWTLLVLGAAILAGVIAKGRVSRVLSRIGRAIARPPTWSVAAFMGLLGAALTAAVVLLVFDGRAIFNDANVQLVQARYFAGGKLSGPPLAMPEFWTIQFMVQTAAGWVSQYPPAHALWLAAGIKLGGPWIAVAATMGVLGVFSVLSFERLLPDRIAAARLGALLAVTSPMLLALAGTYMNHATVAAFAALALWLSLRAETGRAVWALAAGGAMGVMVATRPISGLLIGAAVTAGVWLTAPRQEPGLHRPWLLRRFAWWALGGLPFAVGFGWFNARFFGSPLTLGYTAAAGPSHGLGFHVDPWGRVYGFTQALGYTSTELISLGRELLGTVLPVAALIGLYLLVARRLERGERILTAWALLPVLASALYWHHDLIVGPRMLGEAVPAWSALLVLATIGLARAARRDWLSDAVAVLVLIAIGYGLAVGGWGRVVRLTGRVVPVPEVTEPGPSLVFVHESWQDRIGARLAARPMRLDSVRALINQFDPCRLEGALVGAQRPEEVVDRCQREIGSDRLGRLGLTDYLWRGDLPGLGGAGVLWTRDLGPEANARLIEAYPDRTPLLAMPDGEGRGDGLVVPYRMGVDALWGPTPP
ncbi:hypothetical protein [Candidatus Palauibacter soopunensis]|uniref:hypothetical protein n=1 Tax=Candidatus Palauibacter soopunensis TaxID=3056739 RepID=UPI00239C7FBA|nr:hypothetical protein [Candidatus Palauibacter soopunensis]MDE2878484.1 hypothetical protein [Candidatus Palauibacter soopunensis]